MKHEYKGLVLGFDGELTQGHVQWLLKTVSAIASEALDVPPTLMVAAALAGEGKGQVPSEVELQIECAQRGRLPHDGGILDQPAGLLQRMRTLTDIWQAFVLWQAREAGKEGEFAEKNPRAWAIIQAIGKLRG